MSQAKARISIEGKSIFLFNVFSLETAMPLEKQPKQEGVAGNSPNEWKTTYLADKDGRLYIPGNYAFATIVGGSKNIKKGRGSIQTIVQSCLSIIDERIYFDRYMPKDIDTISRNPDEDVYLDVRKAINPGTGAACIRYRVAMKRGWKSSFTIAWDDSLLSKGQMNSAIIEAGNYQGIGNGRKIGCGRFDLKEFEVLS